MENAIYSQDAYGLFDRYREEEQSGDALFESNKRRKKVTIYALHRSRKALLKKGLKNFFKVCRIKTGNTFWQGTTEKESKSRSRSFRAS